MSNRLGLLTAALSLCAAAAAGAAFWQAQQTTKAVQMSGSYAVQPLLTFEADARPGAGLRLTNNGVGPAFLQAVRLALPRADGSLDWMTYPAADNGAAVNLWEFLGMADVNDGMPEGQFATAILPPPGAIWPVGNGIDLIRFPAGTVLPEAWTVKNAAKAETVLNGLLICVEYAGLDKSIYQLDRGGLCARQMTDADHRYLGTK